MNKISVVIPVYNEVDRVVDTVQQTLPYVDHVIVVDDGSQDATHNALQQINNLKLTVLRHRVNLGKGSALKTGCEAACLLGTDIIVTMDGDGQHLAQDIPSLIKPLLQNQTDIVFGSRIIGKGMPAMKLFGNALLSFLSKHFLKINLRDSQSGFRAFTQKTYKIISWDSHDYSLETEVIARVSQAHLKFEEIPIHTVYYNNYKGTTFIDGIKIFLQILRYKFL